ncbi:MAG: hypothetical protein DKT66_11455 [Candidatus Melainabacteria bacterium]|nr:MAG: hypothetical protein DKT66_11455 [Candidatus Melainabacteria bacterium]
MKERILKFKYFSLLVACLSLVSCSTPQEAKEEKRDSNNGAQKEVLESVRVQSKTLERTIRIPSELAAFREVEIYPKIQGFIKTIHVDRGSIVKAGQILIEIVAPEMNANYREAQAKYDATKSSLLQLESKIGSEIAHKEEAEAILAADEANYQRILIAAKTPGAVAPVDIEAAQKKVEADKAKVRSAMEMVNAARSGLESEKDRARSVSQSVSAVKELKDYLIIRAPFDGVISERNVHEGSLVSSSSNKPPMLKIEQISHLRLLVPVPETAISGVRIGSAMRFTVAAFVGKTFVGRISRISHELERNTRTMIVELDVNNEQKDLEPGMYAEVSWQMSRPYKTLFVPSECVLSKEDKTYVAKVENGHIKITRVSRGLSMGKLVEIVGDVKVDDEVLLNPSMEKVEGLVTTHVMTADELHAGNKEEP